MLVEKPEEVRHENAAGNASAIYGIDSHPTKPLFATAGGDGSVKIWSLEPNGRSADGVASFDLLATLAFHQQAVNCVRWAAHGRYIASGSDDQLVLLYELQAGAPPPVPFGSNAKPNKQNWVRCSTLKRHTMDVQDVAWSPDDRLLATCSIDNTICIWDVDDATGSMSAVMNQPLHTLAGHNGWVKGVAWDPVGKYLTSAGEDKTVRVWRVDNWQQAKVISEPFETCASTSHFRRLSWSPDGSVLCGTHGFKSKKNIAALLDRATWSNDVDFVGHQGVVTCTRFNPKLFVKDPASSSDKEYACCAVGGDDATVSIWLAHMARPLAVMKECFEASVTDLSWSTSSNSSMLLASSLDGSICCFHLNGDEMGTPVSDVRQSKLLQAKYGSRAGITLASTFVENAIQLELEDKSSTKAQLPSANTLVPKKKKKQVAQAAQLQQQQGGGEGGQAVAKPTGVNILQAVSKHGGKKRIAPVLLNHTPANGQLGPHAMAAAAAVAPPPPEAARPNAASIANKIQNILGPTEPAHLGDTSLLDERMAGKPSGGGIDAPLPPAKAPPSVVAVATSGTTVEQHRTKAEVAKKQQQQQRELSLKRKRDGERSATSHQSAATAAGAAVMAKAKEVTPRPHKMLTAQSIGSGADESSEPLLPVFPFRLFFSVEIDISSVARTAPTATASSSSHPTVTVEVTVHNIQAASSSLESDAVESGPVYSTVRCTEATNVKWVDRLPGRVVAVVGNATLCAVATSTGDLFLLSASGRRLFPCITLGCPLAVMECSPLKSPFLMVILANGAVKIWDITSRRLHLNDSIEALVSSSYGTSQRVTLLRSNVTTSGHPMITVAVTNPCLKGSPACLHSYTFDDGMRSWMRVADDSFGYSDFHTSLPTDAVVAHEIPMGPLRRLQNASGFSRAQRGIASAMLKETPDPIMQRSVTRAHLEHQVATAVVLQSPREYQYWLKAYVRFLAADEDVARLEELCAELLGPFQYPSAPEPSTSSTSTREWPSDVLGLSKRNLLQGQVLPTMATNRMLQRVVAKYQLMLSEIETRGKDTVVATSEPHVTTTKG